MTFLEKEENPFTVFNTLMPALYLSTNSTILLFSLKDNFVFFLQHGYLHMISSWTIKSILC